MNNQQIKNGQAVKITFGMGRTILGQISDKIENKFGTQYEITTEDGVLEYASGFVKGNEIGARLL